MICLAVTYIINPGEEERAAAHLRAMVGPPRAEPGCRMYLVHRSTVDPRKFFLYEQYDDQAALDDHRAAPHFLEHIRDGVWPLAESRTPEFYEPMDD